MAITTVAGISSGLLPPYYATKGSSATTSSTAMEFISSWYNSTFPPAAPVYTGGLAGQALTSSIGAIPCPTPAAGQNSYLARVNRLGVGISNPGNLILIDRLWENSGLVRTSTSTQTFSSAAWAARDLDQSTNGKGVYIALEVSAGIFGGATGPSTTMSYTNSVGTAGRTASVAGITNPSQGRFFIFPLQAGDVGVRSIQSITFSASWGTGGAFALVAFRPIVVCSVIANFNRDIIEDAVSMAMPRLFNNTVLQSIVFAFSGSDSLYSEYQITQG